MKRTAVAVLAALLCAALSLPARRQPGDAVQRLARLYEDRRFFELRDALASLEDDRSIDLEFFRGAVDEIFNRLDPAIVRLRGYLEAVKNGPPRTLMKEAWVNLADAFRRLGRYREAAEAYRSLLRSFGPVLDEDERANYGSQAGLWSALAGVPPQRVDIAADTVIRMTNRHFPVTVSRRTFFVEYDTGSNLSVLYKSIADELGIAIYGPAIKIQSGTGRSIDGRTGVVPEMRLGSLVIRNAVFLVLPDELFPSDEARFGVHRRGLLGAPVLEGFREFTETSAGELLVPVRPGPRSPENMCFYGFMPVVEVLHRGSRLCLCLDTGATATSLFPPFHRRYRGEINARTRLRESSIGGVGGSRTVPVRVLDEFAFQTGGKDFALRKVIVQTQETHSDTRYFPGTLGVDILPLCSRMTLNFVSMSFILE